MNLEITVKELPQFGKQSSFHHQTAEHTKSLKVFNYFKNFLSGIYYNEFKLNPAQS